MTDDARIPALQLLLGDASDDTKRALFYKAFPDSFILLKGDAKILQTSIRQANADNDEIYAKADGSTPLGILAVQQVRDAASVVKTRVNLVAAALGISL
jgi:hypothetical protein